MWAPDQGWHPSKILKKYIKNQGALCESQIKVDIQARFLKNILKIQGALFESLIKVDIQAGFDIWLIIKKNKKK